VKPFFHRELKSTVVETPANLVHNIWPVLAEEAINRRHKHKTAALLVALDAKRAVSEVCQNGRRGRKSQPGYLRDEFYLRRQSLRARSRAAREAHLIGNLCELAAMKLSGIRNQLNGRRSFQHGICHLVLADVAVISYERVCFEVVNFAASKTVRTWLCVG
jgi:hypothetical protein